MVADVQCWRLGWAPDGSGILCENGEPRLFLPSVKGQVVWTRALPFWTEDLRCSRQCRTVYVEGTSRDGRPGIWAIADGGRGALRLIVACDDPVLQGTPWFSVGRDRLHLSVAEFESDIWVAKLNH
jgi:hypothetical protein